MFVSHGTLKTNPWKDDKIDSKHLTKTFKEDDLGYVGLLGILFERESFLQWQLGNWFCWDWGLGPPACQNVEGWLSRSHWIMTLPSYCVKFIDGVGHLSILQAHRLRITRFHGILQLLLLVLGVFVGTETGVLFFLKQGRTSSGSRGFVFTTKSTAYVTWHHCNEYTIFFKVYTFTIRHLYAMYQLLHAFQFNL